MAKRRKLQLSWLNERARKASLKKRLQGLIKKTNELSILCGMEACLVFFNREEDQLVVWPSHAVANSLVDNFYSLSDHERNKKAVDPESFLQTNIQKLEKKIAESWKVVAEFEMDHLMFELQHGRRQLADLSPTEVENLISYTGKKMMWLRKEMGSTEQLAMSVDEASLAATLRGSNVPSSGWGGSGFNVMGTGSIYYFDQWVSPKPEVQEPGKVSTGLDLNMDPSDVDEDMGGTSRGESSRANGGGGEDDAE